MKSLPLIMSALAVMFAACSEEETFPPASDANADFTHTLVSHEEVVVNLTQAEVVSLWSNREARLVSVIKPESAIRRWWKAFTLTFESDGDYIYSTIEDDIIPAKGSWAFAHATGTDIVLFNDDEEEGEYFERFAELTFKTTDIGTVKFEMKINVIESNRYSPDLVGEWVFIFQL